MLFKALWGDNTSQGAARGAKQRNIKATKKVMIKCCHKISKPLNFQLKCQLVGQFTLQLQHSYSYKTRGGMHLMCRQIKINNLRCRARRGAGGWGLWPCQRKNKKKAKSSGAQFSRRRKEKEKTCTIKSSNNDTIHFIVCGWRPDS